MSLLQGLTTGAAPDGRQPAAVGTVQQQLPPPPPPKPGPRGTTGPGGCPDRPKVCVSFDRHGFCSYGLDCDFEHEPRSECAAAALCTDRLVSELNIFADAHAKSDYTCAVCGTKANDDFRTAAVGDTSAYRFCNTCGQFFFYPHVQLIALRLLKEAGTDYGQYKREVDRITKSLAPTMRVPFHYEAGRWGTTRFAWTLAGPRHVSDAVGVVQSVLPRVDRFVSMGAGTGYLEHVLLHVARKQLAREPDMLAFDLTPLPNHPLKFDVQPQVGGLDSLRSLSDMSNTCLVLCWPPFGSSWREESTMGYDATNVFRARGGKCLLYIGDVNATGDWRFHELLASDWRLCPECLDFPLLPVWEPKKMGLRFAGNDTIGVYTPREAPLSLRPWGPVPPPADEPPPESGTAAAAK